MTCFWITSFSVKFGHLVMFTNLIVNFGVNFPDFIDFLQRNWITSRCWISVPGFLVVKRRTRMLFFFLGGSILYGVMMRIPSPRRRGTSYKCHPGVDRIFSMEGISF